ncbi:MAG TPA: hypothetical protein VJ508_13065, partial [Saprospiraceae bacterium]|nr:hypothetical protein [Saprospiraceae bacterium]
KGLAAMSRRIARICPRCNGYLGVVLGKRSPKSNIQSVNGSCVVCNHKLHWTLVHGAPRKVADYSGHIPKLFDPLKHDFRFLPTDN